MDVVIVWLELRLLMRPTSSRKMTVIGGIPLDQLGYMCNRRLLWS